MKYFHPFKVKIVSVILAAVALFSFSYQASALSVERSRTSTYAQALGTTVFAVNGVEICEWEINKNGILKIEVFVAFEPSDLFSINSPWYSRRNEIKKIRFVEGAEFLQHIGSKAFLDYKNLELIDLSGCSNLKSIDSLAFEGCPKLTQIIFPKTFESKFFYDTKNYRMNDQECRKYYGMGPNCHFNFLNEVSTAEMRVAYEEKMKNMQNTITILQNKHNEFSSVIKLQDNRLQKALADLQNSSDKIKKLEQENVELKKILASTQSTIQIEKNNYQKMLAAAKQELDAKIDNKTKAITTNFDQKMNDLSRNINTLVQSKNAEFQKTLANLKQEVNSTNTTSDNKLKALSDTIDQKNAEYSKAISSLQSKYAELQKLANTIKQESNSANSATNKAIDSKLQVLSASLNQKMSECSKLIKNLQDKDSEFTKTLAALKQEFNSTNADSRLKSLISSLEKQKAEFSKNITDINNKINKLVDTDKNLELRIARNRSSIRELQDK